MPINDLPRYAVITPVRDEESHLARTAEALLAQTHRPSVWVIVDDGSTDATAAIAEAASGTSVRAPRMAVAERIGRGI